MALRTTPRVNPGSFKSTLRTTTPTVVRPTRWLHRTRSKRADSSLAANATRRPPACELRGSLGSVRSALRRPRTEGTSQLMVALKRHESSRNFCVLATSPSSANLAPRAATSEERRGEERAGPTAGSMTINRQIQRWWHRRKNGKKVLRTASSRPIMSMDN